jgi:hypothetical protein
MIVMVVEWCWGDSVLCFIVVLVVEMVMFGWVVDTLGSDWGHIMV